MEEKGSHVILCKIYIHFNISILHNTIVLETKVQYQWLYESRPSTVLGIKRCKYTFYKPLFVFGRAYCQETDLGFG